MDPRLLKRYNEELRFIREMGVEFAQRYPKIAGRLDLGENECADPYVERLLEGFAFLTARIQVKMDAEFPKFTQHLLEMVYPHYLAPTPSMAVVRFDPDLNGGVTEEGFKLPRNTELRSSLAQKGRATCEFRTAQDVMLWPIKLTKTEYLPLGEAGRYAAPRMKNVKAALRFKFETVGGIQFQQLALDQLPLHLLGGGDLPMQIYELLIGHNLGVVVQGEGGSKSWRHHLHRRNVKALGFDEDEALLPYGPQSFSGYRLLQEYFALPQRFLFVELGGLQPALKQCNESVLEVVVLLDAARPELEAIVNHENFALNCTPVINLFSKRADRIHLKTSSSEQHLVVDRTRPRDYEVYSVQSVTGFGSGSNPEQSFRPFYSVSNQQAEDTGSAHYTLRRRPALAPVSTQEDSGKSRYLGSEVYLSLVDAAEAPYRSDLKQLGVDTLCTNRSLAQYILPGQGKTDFTLEIGAPVNAVHCLTGPTDPRPSYPEGEYNWRLINHLSLNYLTLMENGDGRGADALRELLSLYGDFAERSVRGQIKGILNTSSRQVVRRIPVDGPMAFGRGVEVGITLDESAFEGASAFMLSAVLERFFSQYSSINSFTQTVVKTRERGEIMTWPVRTGNRTLM
jgi:type VI secretion system protein ImpG